MTEKNERISLQPLAEIPEAAHLRIVELIGHGGMGIVYKAKDSRRNEIVAVKVLHQDLCVNRLFVQRFLREAASLVELSHPNIVKGYEVGGSNRGIFFTMEFVDGRDLSQLSAERGPLDPWVVLQVMLQAARALSYAFAKGKIHRDIKPANLLLTSDGAVKLSDFGLIKGEDDPGITGAALVIGTPYYMSPEVVSGCQDIDIRSDIYSLGMTVIHLLTGSPPFAGQDMPVVMTKQITDTVELSTKISVPGGDRFRYILSKMVSKRRELRYQTPDDLLADLEKISADGQWEEGPIPMPFGRRRATSAAANNLFSAPTVEAPKTKNDAVLDHSHISSLGRRENLTRSYSPGAVLFYEGDDSRDFYILTSGKCEVLRSGKRLAIIDQPGASFGEISAILGGRRTATIRALEQTACSIIPLEQFKFFLAENHEVQQQVMEIALTRLKDLNEKFVRSQNVVGRGKIALRRLIRQMAILSPADVAENVRAIYEILDAFKE